MYKPSAPAVPCDEVGILLNGNGKFEGLPLNRALYDDHGQIYDAIAGTFLVVGLTEDDFTSLTPEQIEKFKEKYQSPEIFNLFNGELHVMKMPPQEQKEQKKSQKNDAQQKHPAKKKKRSGFYKCNRMYGRTTIRRKHHAKYA